MYVGDDHTIYSSHPWFYVITTALPKSSLRCRSFLFIALIYTTLFATNGVPLAMIIVGTQQYDSGTEWLLPSNTATPNPAACDDRAIHYSALLGNILPGILALWAFVSMDLLALLYHASRPTMHTFWLWRWVASINVLSFAKLVAEYHAEMVDTAQNCTLDICNFGLTVFMYATCIVTDVAALASTVALKARNKVE